MPALGKLAEGKPVPVVGLPDLDPEFPFGPLSAMIAKPGRGEGGAQS